MKMKPIITVVVGAIISTLLLIYVVGIILNNEKNKLYAGAQKVQVLVAIKDLPIHAFLTEDTVAIKNVFKSTLGSYVLTPKDYIKIKNKQLRYPVKKHEPLLSLYVKPMIDCTSSPSIRRIYTHDDLGIQIDIPNNWKQISADEAGQEKADPESDLLRLGFFDPDTGEKGGIFILTILGEDESKQTQEDLKNMEGFEKIDWKNRTCYFGKEESEKHNICESYTIVQKGSVVSFMVGYSQSHVDSITNILNEIIF